MTAPPAWTPAPRPGIIPLHPLTFGTILGRSFSVLRHNPAVLLGFAIGVQALVFLVLIVGSGGIAFAAFSRLDTLRPGTDEFDAVMAGSTAVVILGSLALGLIALVVQVLVQGVVIAEVAHATVAEKLRLRGLWQRVKPAIWRLLGYSLLLALAVLIVVGGIVAAIVALGAMVDVGLAIGLSVLVIIGSIPLMLWLSIKLLLVPSILVLERATIRDAVARSWTLVRGRFWPALGVIVLISFIFGAIGQVVSLPASLALAAVTSIFAPTGDTSASVGASVILLIVTYVITFVIQAIALVVSATAGALIYIDNRMRKEGLDLDLLAYVERRDAGEPTSSDPWEPHPERQAERQNTAGYAPTGYPAPYAAQQGYPPPAYGVPQGPPAYGAPGQGYPAQYGTPAPAYGATQGAPALGYPAPPGYPAPAYGVSQGAPEHTPSPFYAEPAAPQGAPTPEPAPPSGSTEPAAPPDPAHQPQDTAEPGNADAAAPREPGATQWAAPGQDGTDDASR